MPPQTVLITGASGLIGTALRQKLANRCRLRALNRRPLDGIDCHRADIGDLDAIQPAFEGVDAVVHLAAHIGDDWQAVQKANNAGTAHVFEAARQAGVGRVVFASSGSVLGGYSQLSPYRELLEGRYDEVPGIWPWLDHHAPLRPVGLYAASKVWGEALARHFYQEHGLSVHCLRFGRVNPEDRPTRAREWSVWCSQRDAVQMIEKCLWASPEVDFDIFYVTSANKWGYRDLEHARQKVGFVPADRAEDFR